MSTEYAPIGALAGRSASKSLYKSIGFGLTRIASVKSDSRIGNLKMDTPDLTTSGESVILTLKRDLLAGLTHACVISCVFTLSGVIL